MSYTTNQLISGAFYASGIVSREFETVSGQQVSDGLQWLNDILAEKRVDDGMIPYETTYPFIASVGQEKYFIPNLIQIDTLVFYLDKVRYAMKYSKRNQYFGSSRVQNIQSLPFNWYFERQTGGGNLYIYFEPDKNYPMEIHGSFNMNNVSLGQDLSLNNVVADLGVPTFYGLGSLHPLNPSQLIPGQLVVNQVDLAGNYPNIGALVNYINTGIIPGVTANINVNDFVLSSATQPPIPIYVQTTGYTNGTNFIGSVAATTFSSNLGATYDNGVNGVGATLTANVMVPLAPDDYTVQLGDIILVASQTDPIQNGSYILTTLGTFSVPWVLTRTNNYNQAVQIGIGNLFNVTNGFIFANYTFIQVDNVSVIGTSPINFSFFAGLTFSNFSTLETPLYEIFNANGLDQFYLTYLRYALANRICAEYNYDTPPNVVMQLAQYEALIKKKSKLLDLRMEKTSTLQKKGAFNWGFINLGVGWIAPS